MKMKFDHYFWGFLFIIAAGLILAQLQGWIDIASIRFWALALSLVGLIFLIRYLVAGLRYWGWLFPVCIFPALAGLLWLVKSGIYHTWMVAPLLAAMAIPLLVAFIVDFRKNWWALIPVFAMAILFLLIMFGDKLPGEIFGASLMIVTAVPFVIFYLAHRKNWWVLIPVSILAILGIMILISTLTSQWVGALFALAISASLFYVFIKYPQHWWAFIPAGIIGSVSINAILTNPALGMFAQSSFPGAVLFLGWAATFGWLWRQRRRYSTTWALIPATIAGIVTIILLAIASLNGFGLITLLIAAGAGLIYIALRSRKEKQLN